MEMAVLLKQAASVIREYKESLYTGKEKTASADTNEHYYVDVDELKSMVMNEN